MTTSLPHTSVARRDLSALIAGIPAVIGFPPTDSLVLFTFRRKPTLAMATTVRVALPAPADVQGVADDLVAAAVRNQAAAVIAVVVGGTAEQHRPVVDVLREGFAAREIVLVHASWVRTISHGERWQCYEDPQCTDEIPDPQASAWAAAAAIAGRPVYRDQEDMAAQLAPDPPETLARRERLLDGQLRKPRQPYTEDDLAADAALMTRVLTEAEETPELPNLTDRQIVRLVRALFHPEVKDECMAVALSVDPHAAERVWTVLIRALPAPERAEPAVLLALSAYLRGAGVLAALAVGTALDAHPAHALALLLQHALTSAVPPDALRTLLIRSILRNEGIPDPGDDEPPWDTTSPDGPDELAARHTQAPSDTSDARAAATPGLVTSGRAMTLEPLTAFLPPHPSGAGMVLA
jgi:hypothetical protein